VRQAHGTKAAPVFSFAAIHMPMVDKRVTGWRDRLVNEILKATKEGGTSYKALSRRAGLGENFAEQIVKNDRDLRVESLIALCEALDIDVVQVLTGVRSDPEIQEAIAAFSALREQNPEAWDGFRAFLRAQQRRLLDEADSSMEALSQRIGTSRKAAE
jgi:transcriptional regulator with XRE-family HTH domain